MNFTRKDVKLVIKLMEALRSEYQVGENDLVLTEDETRLARKILRAFPKMTCNFKGLL